MGERKRRLGLKQRPGVKKLPTTNPRLEFSRRTFLGGAVGVGMTSAFDSLGSLDRLGNGLYAGVQSTTRIPTPDEFKRKLRGGIVVIPTPFTADFKVDFSCLRRMIRGALAKGFQAYELTYGDGRLWCLSEEELR